MKVTVKIASMKVLRRSLFCLVILGSTLAQARFPDRIIGKNDFVKINAGATNIPSRYKHLLGAFGKFKDLGCTGTHIGKGYVLTAGHCFWAPPTVQHNLNCATDKIEWGVFADTKPYMVSQCEKIIIEQMNEFNDFALIKVSPIPPVAIAPDMNRHAATGDTLTVFSHQSELTLHWSGLCGVEYVQHPDFPHSTLKHKCDTSPGSSGAALINALTLKVVGIHGGGVDGIQTEEDPNRNPVNTGLNYGTSIISSPLYEALLELGFK